MYLKKIKINNFRKFRVDNNTVEFVDAENHLKPKLCVRKKSLN